MKKLIAVDIDGTLINSDMVITKKTKDALIEAQKQGHVVVISSGRAPSGVEPFYKELEMDKYEGYICNYNGAMATDVKTNEVVIDHKLDFDKMKELLEFSKDLDIYYVIYYNDIVYTNNLDTYNLDDILKKSHMLLKYEPNLTDEIDFAPNNILFTQDPKLIEEPASKISEKFGGDFDLVFSERFYYEAMPKDVTKGHTLIELADKLGIDRKDVIAFGDQNNDYTMIKEAGVGVAMGNAIDELKEIADYITLTNDEDGIADYLYKNVLK